jgi:hypothetical protein
MWLELAVTMIGYAGSPGIAAPSTKLLVGVLSVVLIAVAVVVVAVGGPGVAR